MYYSGQVIYDKKSKKPIKIGDTWDLTSHSKNYTHFRITTMGINKRIRFYDWGVAIPDSVEQAEEWMNKAYIEPAIGRKPIDKLRSGVSELLFS